jgi:lipopolysaccharide transport system ATP-binding protein
LAAAQEICVDELPVTRRFRLARSPQSIAKAYFDQHLIPKSTFAYGVGGATISEPSIRTLDGALVNNLVRRQEYIYSYMVEFHETAFSVRFGMLIKTITGFELGGCASSSPMDTEPVIEKGTRIRVQWKIRCRLNPGTYFLNAGVMGAVDGVETYLARIIDAAAFRVQSEEKICHTAIVDLVESPCTIIEETAAKPLLQALSK